MSPRLSVLEAGHGKVHATASGWILSIPAGPAGAYRLAQLYDYRGLSRHDFPLRPPLKLRLEARADPTSSGTWGFGFWNNPFGAAFSPLGPRLLLPCAPQAVWFFWASPASYLSFRDDLPANGFLAQSFRSEPGWRWVSSVALQLATRNTSARASIRRHVAEASRQVPEDSASWHAYEIHWTEARVQFAVDGRCILQTETSPRLPLGLVMWIDNQFAEFDSADRISWGLETTPSDCQLEIRDLRIST